VNGRLPPLGPASSASTGDVLAVGSARTPPWPNSDLAPPRIPDHTLLRRIGGGSYGDVWLARSTLGTLRAVKVVRRAAFDDDRPYEREFAGLQKFEPLSRTHEGFVDLLQVGRNDAEGWFYYVMELADDAAEPRGSNQSSVNSNQSSAAPPVSSLNTDPLITDYSPLTLSASVKLHGAHPLDACLRIARTLTEALVELHRHGLVHRDIKPSNIIFVNGVPKLADVGLVAVAKGVGQDRSFVGTEGFIPPEGPGTPAADLYSLGIVLYVLGTGKSHRHFPEPPPDLVTRPDRERWLEFSAVIHRAAAADPKQRYASAGAMLADLALLDAGKSVKRRQKLQHLFRNASLVSMIAGIVALALWAAYFRQPADNARLVQLGWSTNLAAINAFRKANSISVNEVPEKRETARQLYEEALRLDPNFAIAHASLAADLYTEACNDRQPLEAWTEAERHLQRAVSIEPRLAWAHLTRGQWLGLVRHDWRQAEAEMLRAFELEPSDNYARSKYAMLLIHQGRLFEAIAEVRKATEADVTGVGAHNIAALALYYDRQFTQALAELDQVDQLAIKNSWGQQTRAHTLMALGRTDEAIALYRQVAQMSPSYLWPRAFLFHAVTVTGKAVTGDPTLQELLDRSNEPRGAYGAALAYTALGDKEKALDWLEKAYLRREWDLVEVKVDFRVDSLRNEKRFHGLLMWMNLEP